jgi:hypothetical protein
MRTYNSNVVSRIVSMQMKSVSLLVLMTSGVALAGSCENYTPVGQLCSRTVVFGWGTAGQGTQSVIDYISRPAASGPVTFQITQINSSLGTSYSGYFGITMSTGGAPASTYTSGTIPAATLQPGATSQTVVSQACFDSTCTAPAPFGAVANMFSVLLTITANTGADLDVTPLPLLTVQFLTTGADISFQEQEQALDVSAIGNSARASVNEGAADEGRYYYSGTALLEPYTAFSVSNPSATTPLSVTVVLYDFSGDSLASIPLPPLPPLGAAGYLLVGRTAGDALGLLPYDTLLPSGADEIFHGVYGAQANGPVVFLSQEFYGNSMLNAFIIH